MAIDSGADLIEANEIYRAAFAARKKFDRPFKYVVPPFSFNHPNVDKYPAEISGHYLLSTVRRRLGWASYGGRRILDFGCGVRIAQTFINLSLDFIEYTGVDINRESIQWLNENIVDSRMNFILENIRHPIYNPDGGELSIVNNLVELEENKYDLISMYSVITHQTPDYAAALFKLLRKYVKDDGFLYFTSLLDPEIETYKEGVAETPTLQSTYNPAFLTRLVIDAGWTVRATYPPIMFQQPAFVCAPTIDAG